MLIKSSIGTTTFSDRMMRHDYFCDKILLHLSFKSVTFCVLTSCRLVQTMDYSVIVFDTAPTGHTLRLLQFPSTLEKGLAKMMSLKNKFGGLLNQVCL